MADVSTVATKRGVLGVAAGARSPQVIAAGLAMAAVTRAGVADWSWLDAVVAGVTVGSVGVVEWVIHRSLLHAPETAWTSRRLGTGSGHRRHHLDPTDSEWLLLRGVDAAVFMALIAAGMAAWTIPFALVVATFGAPTAVAGPVLTGVVAAWSALMHYEWTHLLVHTRYRPRTRYYRRLAKHHRMHHFRDEQAWLGVTSRVGDRLFHTLEPS